MCGCHVESRDASYARSTPLYDIGWGLTAIPCIYSPGHYDILEQRIEDPGVGLTDTDADAGVPGQDILGLRSLPQ